MSITKKQAKSLGIKKRTQWSPYVEKCCLLVSANESYQRAEEDIQVLTGIKVTHSTQQRMVHRQEFKLPTIEPETETISIDGGKVRLRTPKGQACEWRDYKAVNLHQKGIGAFFRENENLVNWVNQQPLANPLVCLGDGHHGIWNIFANIGDTAKRLEILDWYHLVENLGKVGGSLQRLNRVESLLWIGDIDGAIAQFSDLKNNRATNFLNYLHRHRSRIVNYAYFQAEGITIGSGAIESTVKQIGRRIKISGAQWNAHNAPQVLRQRAAYLNGDFSARN